MGTTFFLVRHASHDLLGRVLAGRSAGVSLNAAGRSEAGRLAERLAREEVAAIHSSPMERAWQTAEPIAHRLGLPVEVAEELNEIDFGDWSGADFAALEREPQWERWNSARSVTRPPGGETMPEAQARALRHIERVRCGRAGRGVVLVSHGDIIKSVLAHVFGLSLDGLHRFEVSPASVSTLVLGDWGGKVLSMNEVVSS